ncbi:hypothetical protein BGZ82_006951 [Podila clonocystis]|nr:hypothetical protein BGZ82_006951 [Podila clonocystis]
MATSVSDIHPLVEAIAHDLTPNDLCSCLRVSYAWNINFSPFLWRRIRLYSERQYGKFDTPLALGALALHINQVQVEETNIPRFLDLLNDTSLHNLSTLRMDTLARPSSALVQLLSLSTNLQSLELLGYFGPSPIVEQFLSTLRSHPRLRELSHDPATAPQLRKTWKLFSLDTKEFPPTPEALLAEVWEFTGSESPTFKVKDLTIGPSLYSGGDIFASFLRFCPNVERLNIQVLYHAAIPQILLRIRTRSSCDKL